jgi:putative PIN family toxin of toxin-antitoxin system
LKVCLDTNILVSGIFWKGAPGKVIDLWVNQKFDLLVSLPILDEYQKILRKIGRAISPSLAETWIKVLIEKASILSFPPSHRRWSRDIHDDKFIHCALAGGADCLVSGDLDLLELKGHVPVKILTAREFLDGFLSISKAL